MRGIKEVGLLLVPESSLCPRLLIAERFKKLVFPPPLRVWEAAGEIIESLNGLGWKGPLKLI